MLNIEFIRTSQGLDVFVAGVRVGAVVDCPALDCAFFRTLGQDHHPYPSVSAAVLALTMAVERATRAGALSDLTRV